MAMIRYGSQGYSLFILDALCVLFVTFVSNLGRVTGILLLQLLLQYNVPNKVKRIFRPCLWHIFTVGFCCFKYVVVYWCTIQRLVYTFKSRLGAITNIGQDRSELVESNWQGHDVKPVMNSVKLEGKKQLEILGSGCSSTDDERWRSTTVKIITIKVIDVSYVALRNYSVSFLNTHTHRHTTLLC